MDNEEPPITYEMFKQDLNKNRRVIPWKKFKSERLESTLCFWGLLVLICVFFCVALFPEIKEVNSGKPIIAMESLNGIFVLGSVLLTMLLLLFFCKKAIWEPSELLKSNVDFLTFVFAMVMGLSPIVAYALWSNSIDSRYVKFIETEYSYRLCLKHRMRGKRASGFVCFLAKDDVGCGFFTNEIVGKRTGPIFNAVKEFNEKVRH